MRLRRARAGGEWSEVLDKNRRLRINPTNHPMWRATLHHFTYRSLSHGMGEDDAEIFAWRAEHRVVIGPDVWIGDNAILLPGVTVGAPAPSSARAPSSPGRSPPTRSSPARRLESSVDGSTKRSWPP